MVEYELKFRFSNFAVFSDSSRHVSRYRERYPCQSRTHYPDLQSNEVIKSKNTHNTKIFTKEQEHIKSVVSPTFLLWLKPALISVISIK